MSLRQSKRLFIFRSSDVSRIVERATRRPCVHTSVRGVWMLCSRGMWTSKTSLVCNSFLRKCLRFKTYDLQDVDDIHEYLLLKGVDAVSIHGGKEQEERNEAIKLFKVCILFGLLYTLSAGRKTSSRSWHLPNHDA